MILQACPRCSRQYDVTHLVPRSKVRCVCDECFEVSWTRPFTVARLQCGNCGGAVVREDTTCGYCGQRLSDAERRMDSLCPKCFARIPENARHCHACGVEIRPQALAPIPDGSSCPRCERELRIRMLEDVSVIECTACEGIWIQSSVFDRLCHEARAAGPPAAAARSKVRASAAPEPVRYIRCMSCGELMFRRQFRYADRPSGVIIDGCKDHGVWLDRDELERIVGFVQSTHGLPAAPPAPPPVVLLPTSGRRPAATSPLSVALTFLGDVLFGDFF